MTNTVERLNASSEIVRRSAIAATVLHRRRRSALATVSTLSTVFVILLGGDGRKESILRGLFSFSTILAGTSPTFFKRLYRMSHHTFMLLAETLAIFDDKKFRKSCPLLRLSVTIRWLPGGSYLDIALANSLATSTVYHFIDETLSTMDRSIQIKFPYNNPSWLHRMSHRFSREGKSAVDKCCGALDGIAIEISEPASWEVPNSATYFNRKGWFALNVQAMCDAFYRFTFISCLSAGSTHDSTAFSISSLARLLERRRRRSPSRLLDSG